MGEMHDTITDESRRSPELQRSIAKHQAEKANPNSASTSEARQLYMELIYAVGLKHPGETRHQTALRYILEAEHTSDLTAAQNQGS